MPPLSVMIKPASGLCNMRCRYCFYADETEKRTTPSFGMMTEDTLRQVLTHVLAAATGTCTLAFQGGEPTLAGLPFFQKVIEFEKELNVNHCRIEHALQTNGLLIDDAWAEFLAEHHFLVGVSLDGPKELHDKNRLDANGKGTWSRVMHAIQILKKHHVEFNILTVVTGDLCRCTGKVTGFYARNGFSYRQFIPCLDPLGEERGQHPWSLTPELYARYLKESFNCWYRDIREGHKTYHRYFDNLLLIMDGQWPEACGMGGICGRQFVIEADGSVYPCDFYMLDAYCIGNFSTDDFETVEKNRDALGFQRVSAIPHDDCRHCRWKALCRGGCRRDRDLFENGPIAPGEKPSQNLGKNYFCTAYQEFFAYAYPRLYEVYQLLSQGS